MRAYLVFLLFFFVSCVMMAGVAGAQGSVASRVVIPQNYRLHDTGQDVRVLQQFLNAQGFSVAKSGPGSPGHETNYFGMSTYRAVLKFQTAHGLPASGFVGPLTREKIAATTAPAPSAGQTTPAPVTPATPAPAPDSQPWWAPAKGFGAGFFGVFGSAPASPVVSTPRDTTPPVISSVATSSLTSTSVTVTWTTDENADSQVDYGATSSYGSTTALNSTLTTSHTVVLSGLTSNTVYHFRVRSSDAAGNLATGSDQTFTTAAVMPSGALGIWYADQYSTTAQGWPYLPNSVTTVSTSTNLLPAQRRLFSKSQFWSAGSMTAVDDAATCPDGTMEASTVNGTGFFNTGNLNGFNLPAGTYTAALWAKSNTGSSQQFKIDYFNLGVSQIFTATTAWQRFSLTTTFAGGNPSLLIPRSADGVTAINLQICDVGLYPGASDPGATPPYFVGQMYLGNNANDTRPTYANGAVDLSASGAFGLAQFASTTFPAFTAIALVSKVVNTHSTEGFISDAQNYGNLTAFEENNSIADSIFGGKQLNMTQTKNMWTFYNRGWSALADRFDGTNFDLFLDDVRLVSQNKSGAAMPSIPDFVFGLVNGFSGTYKIASVALWNRSLSDAEVRNAYAVLAANAATHSNTITPKRIYIAEGDSITFGASTTNGGYPNLYGANANPIVHGANYAISGSVVSDLTSRAAFEDTIIPPNPNGRKFILSVLVGHNDLTGGGTTDALIANLAAYLDARRAAGWKVIVGTILPSTVPGFDAERDTVNAAIRTWAGVHADAVADFAADPTMGPDGAAANLTYYADGTHPTDAGQAILESIIRPIINGM